MLTQNLEEPQVDLAQFITALSEMNHAVNLQVL
ncbi:hypothetical protein MAN88_41810 [Microcystis aeruginosa]|nr:hypothetical protein MAN88_41810 [Microcystis aeruginosa]